MRSFAGPIGGVGTSTQQKCKVWLLLIAPHPPFFSQQNQFKQARNTGTPAGTLDRGPGTKTITAEASSINALPAAHERLTSACSKSEDGTTFALSRYAGTEGTRPRFSLDS